VREPPSEPQSGDAVAVNREASADSSAGSRAGSHNGPRLELYLLRHADAGDPAAWKSDDARRPLSPKGRKQARRTGRWLAELQRRPDRILTSPKDRALETATVVAAALDVEPVVEQRLGGPLDRNVLAAIVADARRQGELRRLMLVGHDPDFSELASALAGGPIAMKKGALARIDLDLDREPAAGRGTLRWLIPAEALPDR
jgi:phosphohistidine phosphatase